MRLICVTGMHRCGTSLTTKVLELLGVDIGPDEDHDTSFFDNPKGHFESQRLLSINKSLLADLGGSWDDPPEFPPGWLESTDIEPHRADAGRALRELFGDEGESAWKDPRSALLLPFWRTVTPIYRTVLCIRHPDEVAASLATRNGFGPERSAALWLRYTGDARRNAPEHLLLDYGDYFSGLDDQLRDICDYLKLAEPDEAARHEIEQFVDENSRHHDERDRSDGPLMRLATRVYEQIREGDTDDTDTILDAWRALDETRFSRERTIADAEERAEVQLQELADLRTRIDESDRVATDLAETAERVRSELAETTRNLERTRNELTDMRRSRDELVIRVHDISALHRRSVFDHAADRESLRSERDAAWTEAAAERRRREDIQHHHDQVLQSRTFRLARKVRTTVKPVLGPFVRPVRAIMRRLR